jgi:hypothetical protein
MNGDPFDLLRAHVQHQADTIEPSTAVDELIAHITFEHERVPATSSPAARRRFSMAHPPRRWGSATVAAALIVGIGTGAAVTAAVMERSRVEHPETGVNCHWSIDDPVSGSVINGGDDPIAACAALWRDGTISPRGDVPVGVAPPLVGCTAPGRGLEVFPGGNGDVCAEVGMTVADVDTMVADHLRELGDRISEINARCLTRPGAQHAAEALLDELNFDGWQVVLGADGEGCAAIAFGGGSPPTLNVITRPSP